MPASGKIECTNPCGQVPLLPYESCNLGSINLTRFVTPERTIDWPALANVIQAAIRFLDNVIDINTYTLPEIKFIVQRNRKVGLGVMGWADLLILLHIPYDSEEAITLAHQLMSFLGQHSKAASVRLAQERGSFVNWNKSIYYPHTPIRNATLLSIAPTGTISIIAGCSSSIEPLFSLAFQRQFLPEQIILDEIDAYFMDYLRQHNLYSEALMEDVKQTGSVQSISGLPGPVKYLFKTALEIPANRHLQHQLAFSQYVDNAVSKTVNLPQTASRQEIDTLYRSAWQKGAKGITVFAIIPKVNKCLKKESKIQYRTATYVIPNG